MTTTLSGNNVYNPDLSITAVKTANINVIGYYLPPHSAIVVESSCDDIAIRKSMVNLCI